MNRFKYQFKIVSALWCHFGFRIWFSLFVIGIQFGRWTIFQCKIWLMVWFFCRCIYIFMWTYVLIFSLFSFVFWVFRFTFQSSWSFEFPKLTDTHTGSDKERDIRTHQTYINKHNIQLFGRLYSCRFVSFVHWYAWVVSGGCWLPLARHTGFTWCIWHCICMCVSVCDKKCQRQKQQKLLLKLTTFGWHKPYICVERFYEKIILWIGVHM